MAGGARVRHGCALTCRAKALKAVAGGARVRHGCALTCRAKALRLWQGMLELGMGVH